MTRRTVMIGRIRTDEVDRRVVEVQVVTVDAYGNENRAWSKYMTLGENIRESSAEHGFNMLSEVLDQTFLRLDQHTKDTNVKLYGGNPNG